MIWGKGDIILGPKGMLGSMSGDCSLCYLRMTLKKPAHRELGLGDFMWGLGRKLQGMTMASCAIPAGLVPVPGNCG